MLSSARHLPRLARAQSLHQPRLSLTSTLSLSQRAFATAPTDATGDAPVKPAATRARRRAPVKPDSDVLAPAKRRRAPAKAQVKVEHGVTLPPHGTWTTTLGVSMRAKGYMGRISISNPETCDKLANAIVPEGSKGKIIVEGYPGPGQLTRSLLKLPRERISKIIVMEPQPEFLTWLEPLKELDDRIVIMGVDPYDWASFDTLTDAGHLNDVPIEPWGPQLHSTLQFVQHLPTIVVGEQLLNQYVRTAPDRHWLFKYGRVPLDLVTTFRVWQRLVATEKQPLLRCKFGVLSQAAVSAHPSIPLEDLEPYEDHFFPPSYNSKTIKEGTETRLSLRKSGNQHMAMRIEPLENPMIQPGGLDSWDFVTRKLFISKATPISKSISTLAHGAASLLKDLNDPALPAEQRVNPKLTARELTLSQWKSIVDAFEKWPFRPANLSIASDLMAYGKDGRK